MTLGRNSKRQLDQEEPIFFTDRWSGDFAMNQSTDRSRPKQQQHMVLQKHLPDARGR